MICKRCIVSGKVQGVWYRDTTRRKANTSGVKGRAVNMPDGSVEVIACGDSKAVETLCEWLWQGSPMSQVLAVDCEDIPPESFADFSIG